MTTPTPEDEALSADKLAEWAAELRAEAAMHQRGAAACLDKARAGTYADAYRMRVALAGAFERVAEELRRCP